MFPMSTKRIFVAAVLLLGIAGLGCDYYEKPNRPLPTVESMKGHPWIISVWLPG